jgi:transcriptional regulator with PAS, ATPase and Fis domain
MRAAWGEDRWVQEQGTGIFSNEGKLVAIDGLLTDITEQKKKEIQLHEENDRLRSSIKERYRLGSLIGKSPEMQKVYERILKAAATGAPVFIYGESGTGKELVARTVHALSNRKDKAFVAVNCGAITETLLESAFFGHLKGSFSGALADRDGFLMAADGGTLFLDEIGEMPISLQIKLLRVLDGNGFIPVGGNRQSVADFRLISATNRDLGEMVRSGRMREDFYYRINTVPISVPPLRQRKEDLPLLIEHIVNNFSEKGDANRQLPPELYYTLNRHHWPGNIRELQNVVRRYLTLKEISFNPFVQPLNTLDMSRGDTTGIHSENDTVRGELAEVEKNRIVAVLRDNQWNMGKSAAVLGVSRRTLQRRVKKYKLKHD